MATQIQQDIEKISASITKLEQKIISLKRELESGHYGTAQLEKLRQQISRLESQRTSKVTKRDALLDKEGTKELNSLLKAVDTLETKLTSLRGKKSSLKLQGLVNTDEFKKVEKDIANAERALRSFESRIQRRPPTPIPEKELQARFSMLGERAAPPQTRAKTAFTTTATPVPTGGEKVIDDLSKLKADMAKAGMLAEQDSTSSLQKKAKAERGRADSAQKASVDEVSYNVKASNTEKQIDAERKKRLKAEARRAREDQLVDEAGGRLSRKLLYKQALDDQKKAQQAAKQRADSEKRTGEISARSNQEWANAKRRENASLERQARAAEKKAAADAQAASLAEARAKIANDPRYAQALQQASRLGLTAANLRSIQDRGGGVQQLAFQSTEGGVNKNFKTYVDKFGRATPGLSSQFRSFGSDILRDIGQFTKWSIAVAAIYIPIQKLSQLMKDMIAIQTKLADATVAANIPFEKSGEIFKTSYEAAQRAGEAVGGVIDAYTQAYRAAGRYENAALREQKAVELLDSALILSKISALDQASAIDTLSAALLQSELQLDQGEKLLNKWVRVSQVANVDIATLATGVAVLGDSAETAGLDIDHLNGLIAVLAEQSISGAKEAANTAKALVGAYQSDKSEQVLAKYGFALRRANGETREFLDVYGDLAEARAKGLLSEANVSEIALALGGGGVRRAKDASALINSQERLMKIAKESGAVTDDSSLAQDALSKKLETVETASTRVANAFQNLAQTLGDDGGLLDTFKDFLSVIGFLVEGLDKLFEALGRSGPVLATVLGSMLALRHFSGRQQAILEGLGGVGSVTGIGPTGAPIYGPITSTYGKGIKGFGRGLLGDVVQTGTGATTAGAWRGGLLLGALGVGLAAQSNIRQGESDRAAGNAIGGVIGAAIGAYLGGPFGLTIGANIGSSVGESFVKTFLEYEPEFSNFFERVIPLPDKVGTSGFGSEDRAKELAQKAYEESGFSAAELAVATFVANLSIGLHELFGTSRFPTGTRVNKETLIYSNISQKTAEEIAAEERLRALQSGEFDESRIPDFEERRLRLQQKAFEERSIQLQRLSKGEITPTEFGKITEQLSGYPTLAIRAMEAYGEKVVEVSDSINSLSEAENEFLYIATYGNQEQLLQLSQYINDISTLEEKLSTFQPSDIGMKLTLSFGEIEIENEQQLQQLLSGITLEGATAAITMGGQIRAQRAEIPQIVGGIGEPMAEADVDLIRQEAQKLQDQFYSDIELTDDAIKFITENLEDFAVLIGDSAENHYETISGIDQKFWDAAQKILEEAGRLEQKMKGIGFQEFDVDRAMLERLAEQSIELGQTWKDRFGYDFNEETQIAISNEGIVKPLKADFKILALLLQKIVDQNQKQLDGQYNIPEGATFWVPLTAAYYRNTQQGGMGDLEQWLERQLMTSEADTSELNKAGMELQNAAAALLESAAALGFTIVEGKNPFRGDVYNRIEEQINEALYPKRTPRFDEEIVTDTSKKPRFDEEITTKPTEWWSGKYGRDYSPFLDSIKEFFGSIFNLLTSDSITKSMTNGAAQQNAPVQQSRLDLKMESTTNLIVDGRVLATVMKPFLANDLIKQEATQGTITKRYVI